MTHLNKLLKILPISSLQAHLDTEKHRWQPPS